MATKSSVQSVTYDLLRSLRLTTIFGNPGSTEETFLKNFPDDFTYVLGLQEASVIAMADGFAQTTRRPALVNLHSSAGLGNSIGNLVAAYHGHTPLIVVAGQQHRELLIGDPYLSNRDAVAMPRPWVKWSYEPARAEAVPEAFMRAYAMAVQPPAGPVFLSIPLDDWNQPLEGPAVLRDVSTTYAPDPERLRRFAERITVSRRPALILGPDVDRARGWDAGIALAEKLRAAVYSPPLPDRASFPEDHPLFQGLVGMSVKAIGERLAGHDLVVVIGAEVFRYYPYVPGDILPAGTELLQITDDPGIAAAARVGDSLLGDARLSIELLTELVGDGAGREVPKPMPRDRRLPETSNGTLTPAEVYAALSEVRPEHAVFVNESTSTMAQHAIWLPAVEPDSMFATASGGIGWAAPAAVGVALGDRDRGVTRPVIGLIGDGSFQYSVQSLWTAVQHKVPIVYVVMRNHEYSILKSFAALEQTPGVPGLDLPGLDIASVARGLGCHSVDVTSAGDLEKEFRLALESGTTTVIVVTTQPEKATL
ncbi:benzoylformate decarboxylase [Nocardia sp. NPDC004123]